MPISGSYIYFYKYTGNSKPRESSIIKPNDVKYIDIEFYKDNLAYEVENTKKLGSVQATKAFSGMDALPEDFKINYSWSYGAKSGHGTLKVADSTGNGSAESPYTWTVSGVPIGAEVTFTESGYTVDGYIVTVTGSGTAEDKTTATATAQETPKTVCFVNKYEKSSFDASTTISGRKEIKGRNMTDQDVFSFILTSLNDGQHPGMPDSIMRVSNDASGAFSFDLQFKESECPAENTSVTYLYTIKEEYGGETIDGLTYSDQIYYVQVTLTNEHGAISVEQKIFDQDPRPSGTQA